MGKKLLLALALAFSAIVAAAQVNNFNILDGSAAAPPAPVSITVTASPFVWTNAGPLNGFVTVSGGTVSLVELSQNGSAFIAQGAVSGQYAVNLNDQIRVTYSVAPTMTFFGTP